MEDDKGKKFLMFIFLLYALSQGLELFQRWRSSPDQPIQGADFDRDGKTDIAVWRPENGTWYILLSSRNWDRSNPLIRKWGSKGDTAVGSSDYDGDGKTDMAVWRPSNGT